MLPAPWAHAAALPAGLRPEPPPLQLEQGAAPSRPAPPAAQPHSWQPGGREPAAAAETAVPTGGARPGEWAAGEGGSPRELTSKGAGPPCSPASPVASSSLPPAAGIPQSQGAEHLLSPLLLFPLPSFWGRLLWWGAQMNPALVYPEKLRVRVSRQAGRHRSSLSRFSVKGGRWEETHFQLCGCQSGEAFWRRQEPSRA